MRTSRLPDRIVDRLRKEAQAWDRARDRESEAALNAQLDRAELFSVGRPAREPVSVRLDPQDILLVKRLARRRGIPYSQLLAEWVHERVTKDARRRVG